MRKAWILTSVRILQIRGCKKTNANVTDPLVGQTIVCH